MLVLSLCADIHFQYNGFLLGIFLLSINALLRHEPLWGAFWFAVLLQFKHIFLYVAPVYFVYLLFHHCMRRDEPGGPIRGLHLGRLAQLAAVVLSVFGAALGPFLWWGQGAQLLSRLFPFQRGLCHAYWAPNAWVFYNLADKLLIGLARKLHVEVAAAAGASTSRGLVEDVAHVVLPTVRSAFTFVLTLAAMAPVLVKLARRPHPAVFLSALTYCSLCSFMLGQCAKHHGRTSMRAQLSLSMCRLLSTRSHCLLFIFCFSLLLSDSLPCAFPGWHVHEKAILLTILPLR